MSARERAGQGHYKILSLLERSERKIARAKNNGSAAGGGAAPEHINSVAAKPPHLLNKFEFCQKRSPTGKLSLNLEVRWLRPLPQTAQQRENQAPPTGDVKKKKEKRKNLTN